MRRFPDRLKIIRWWETALTGYFIFLFLVGALAGTTNLGWLAYPGLLVLFVPMFLETGALPASEIDRQTRRIQLGVLWSVPLLLIDVWMWWAT